LVRPGVNKRVRKRNPRLRNLLFTRIQPRLPQLLLLRDLRFPPRNRGFLTSRLSLAPVERLFHRSRLRDFGERVLVRGFVFALELKKKVSVFRNVSEQLLWTIGKTVVRDLQNALRPYLCVFSNVLNFFSYDVLCASSCCDKRTETSAYHRALALVKRTTSASTNALPVPVEVGNSYAASV
tara:strand:- start:694 stop:1236 length:543 start_codon:yes stop_codon:yes gene_type:complete